MQTQTLPINSDPAQATAYTLLLNDQPIVAPTDTVYGVMCRFDSSIGIDRLYEAKQRPPQKAIPVLIADIDQLARVTPTPVTRVAAVLMARFWPGALTLVLPALTTLPPNLTAGQPTVAVRMPDHTALRQLIRRAGPLAATSANLSGSAETTTAAEVLAQLAGRIPLVLTDDETETAQQRTLVASTIVDVSLADQEPRILRPGPIAEAVRTLLQQTFGYSC